MQCWPLLLLVAAITAGAMADPITARCFVRHYSFEQLRIPNMTDTIYVSELDLLNDAPLLVEFDDVPLGRARQSGCVRGAHVDMLHFVYADGPQFHAPFCSLPLRCTHDAPLAFALSTMGESVWGSQPRVVADGSVFRPQAARASMRTGVYTFGQLPARHRPLMLRMSSYRSMDRPLPVRVCVRSDQVPYDTPLDAVEVDPPRLLPLMSCTKEFDGRCSTNLGYVNSGPIDIDIGFPKHDFNRLAPEQMLNGFEMPATFERGWHDPASFWPQLHVTWRCDYSYLRKDSYWLLDGYYLLLNNHDLLCNDESDALASSMWEAGADAEARFLAPHQGHGRFPVVLRKPKHGYVGVVSIPYAQAQAAWREAGIENARMSDAVKRK
jgi:hypothetical protein